MLEHQREGIEIVKRKGKNKGRKAVAVNDEEFTILWDEYLSRQISKAEIARRLCISRVTLDKILKEKGLMK